MSLLGDTIMTAPTFSQNDILQGHSVTLVGLDSGAKPIVTKTICTAASSFSVPENACPRWRALNFGFTHSNF
jgi:hypothetical protein